MLKINVAIGAEEFDEATNKFVNSDHFTLELEHSLASLSKWESNFEKPFLGDAEKTTEETLFYIHDCMVVTKDYPPDIFDKFSKGNYDAIQGYIDGKQSATWFNEPKNRPANSRQTITAEVIYGWMIALRIPFETQYWHLNRLLTLIKVCNEQTKTPKKMSRGDAARQQAALNAKRQAAMGTRG